MSSSKIISRDAIINDLLQDLDSGTSRNVFGLPQSGKTIIAQSIRESFEKSGRSKSHRKVILFDTSSSYDEFWKQMLSQFGVDMVEGASARKCFADEISAFLRRTKDGHVLVEVDNFHRIEEYGEEGRMLLADFKWLLDRFSSELGFSCLFFSRKPFRYIQPCDKDNDELADVVADYGIGVFSPDEVVELAGDRKLGEIVYNRTGGLPRLANIMCVKARPLKPNRCKIDEIEDVAKSEIHNFFVGLKAQLLKITICGTNLFKALVERECNQAYRIPFEVAEAIRNTGLGECRLPDSMSLLADFIQREYGQSPATEGNKPTLEGEDVEARTCQGRTPAYHSELKGQTLVDIDRYRDLLRIDADGQTIHARINGNVQTVRLTARLAWTEGFEPAFTQCKNNFCYRSERWKVDISRDRKRMLDRAGLFKKNILVFENGAIKINPEIFKGLPRDVRDPALT